MSSTMAILKNCGIAIEDLLSPVLSGAVDHRAMLYFCTMFRRIGIAHHFSTGTTAHFYGSLFNSGRAYLAYLEQCDEDDKCTSRATPFFDAAACRDDEGAKNIATLARRTVNPVEYEEDFLYVDFLMSLFFREETPDKLKATLDRYEAVLAGDEDTRLFICQALFEKDQGKFDDSLHRFLEELELANEEAMEKESMDPDHALTTAKLSVEGLALVVLAQKAGLSVEDDYLYIPSSVSRAFLPQLPDADAWKQRVSYRTMS